MFVFLVFFSYFRVSRAHQRRILFWGILGALVMRGLFIWAGSAMIEHFHAIIYVFGIFLIFTGIKILRQQESDVDPEKNVVLRLFKRFFPIASDHGGRFILKRDGRWYVTQLLLVLVVVETTDLVFAIDSIPAIFAVTTDPFIVYTSNVFAVLGLRALFFLIAGAMDSFAYLKVGLGLVLAFVGVKMTLSGHYTIPIGASLAVIGALLGSSIIASLLHKPGTRGHHTPGP
jgi:tellurite resistance protein TerC